MVEKTDEAVQTQLGRAIQEARLEAGIPTGAEAARRVGMAHANYWRVEHRSEQPSWRVVHRIVVALGLPLERFFPSQMILAAAHRIARKTTPAPD